MNEWPTKDPDDVLDYGLDWSAELDPADEIESAAWSIDREGLTITRHGVIDLVAVVWLAGGLEGTTYNVTCRMTTMAGRIRDRSAQIYIQTR